MISIRVALTLIVSMFLISGGAKLLDLGKSEGLRLAKKLNIETQTAITIVLLAGVFEIISSLMVIYGAFMDVDDAAIIGLYGLVIFTILATLIFYAFPFKYRPFMSNLSVITGLFLAANVCMLQE